MEKFSHAEAKLRFEDTLRPYCSNFKSSDRMRWASNLLDTEAGGGGGVSEAFMLLVQEYMQAAYWEARWRVHYEELADNFNFTQSQLSGHWEV